MIDIKELRYGNLIADRKGDVAEFHGNLDLRYWNPIPTTPQWLEKFGFTENDYTDIYYDRWGLEIPNSNMFGDSKYYHLRRSRRAMSDLEPEPVFNFFFDGVHVLPCKFVHQLQNAFFALERAELSIKN